MKAIALLLIFALCASYADAFIRYRPSIGCRDCWGRYRREGERYFDGCNRCVCGWDGRASCTYMNCYYNRCYKPFGRPGMYDRY